MTEEHKLLSEQTLRIYKQVREGLNIDLTKTSVESMLELSETESDIENLYKRILLLNRLYQYSAVIQGHAFILQKTYKTPEFYGLFNGIEEVNRAIRTEIESLRSILSNIKEQIKIR